MIDIGKIILFNEEDKKNNNIVFLDINKNLFIYFILSKNLLNIF